MTSSSPTKSQKSKQRYYPLKPSEPDGFLKAVAWFGGRELIASLKGNIIYAIYGDTTDPRPWMKADIYPDVKAEAIKKKGSGKGDVKTDADRALHRTLTDTEWAAKARDQWQWKYDRSPVWREYLENAKFWKKLTSNPDKPEMDEFWFDYIADTGDGQRGVYSVACLCLSDLWLNRDDADSEIHFSPTKNFSEHELLPRGSFLFVGGDTAYHAADYSTLFNRFQTPFLWAFASVRKFMLKNYGCESKTVKVETHFSNGLDPTPIFMPRKKETDEQKTHPEWDGTLAEYKGEIEKESMPELWDSEPLRPLFAVPANHDYYDSVAGFNRQFRRPPFDNVTENRRDPLYKGNIPLKIHSFAREQEASYNALHLPFGWWMFGIDSENTKLDTRQRVFYDQIIKDWQPKKLIIATPEPTTVFGRKCDPDDKTAMYLKKLTDELFSERQPFLYDGKLEKDGFCRLDLSGDVHHYARYWGPNVRGLIDKYGSNNYASLVAGGGGAFFDATETLIGKPDPSESKKDGQGVEIRGEIPPQRVYPDETTSVNTTADHIFDLWKIKKGGYIQFVGAAIAIIIFFCLTKVSNVSIWFTELNATAWTHGFSRVLQFENNPFVSITTGHGLHVFVVLLLSVTAIATSGFLVRRLVNNLKKSIATKSFEDGRDGRIVQLLPYSLPLFVGIAFYIILFLGLQAPRIGISDPTKNAILISGYLNNIILLLHVALAGVLIWAAIEYSNWLPQRFAIFRKLKKQTAMQKLRDAREPLPEKLNWFLRYIPFRRLGSLSREYAIEAIPEYGLWALAGLALIVGVSFFGKDTVDKLSTDLLFTVVVVGSVGLIVGVLAISMGASYQKSWWGTATFILLGTGHAILQIATPFVLMYYGSWLFAIVVFFLIIAVNGLSKSADRYNKNADKNDDSFRGKLMNFRVAAEIMKSRNRPLMIIVWFIYGFFVIGSPFLLIAFRDELYEVFGGLFPWLFGLQLTHEAVFGIVNTFVARIGADILGFLPDLISGPLMYLAGFFGLKYVLSLLAVLTVTGYAGYRLSRVWLSWYLAISLAFNGHNNEAGGAARIEGLKHILRIKVEKKKVTVYVIGIDEAECDLEDLKPKLVDKFELVPFRQP